MVLQGNILFLLLLPGDANSWGGGERGGLGGILPVPLPFPKINWI